MFKTEWFIVRGEITIVYYIYIHMYAYVLYHLFNNWLLLVSSPGDTERHTG